MMPSLAEVERSKYARAWAEPSYRVVAHGLDLWRRERYVFPAEVKTALDVGCGHGRLMAAWLAEGVDAYGVDIVDGLDPQVRAQYLNRLVVCPIWDLEWTGPQFDIGVCADFLEHLPTEKVDLSLGQLAQCCKVVIVQTAEFPSVFRNMPLHLTLKPAAWWRARMEVIGGTVEEFPHRGGRGKKHLLKWML